MIAREDVELMAPVGSFESLMAAVQGGANSIYFGVDRLNMRSRSAFSFTLDHLPQVAGLCRQHGLRAYLALNTVIYDQDQELLEQLVEASATAGIAGVIASDQAAMLCARQRGLPVHLSTQLNISNTQALRFYAQWADVAVLARELTLEQVSLMARRVALEPILGPSGQPIRLEVFAHGALCLAISGRCYLSLHLYNASANRGACLQACRRSYTVSDRETGQQLDIEQEYIMSPKDLCTIGFLDKLLEAGVRVLKIEGRARGPEYVKTVTQCYSEAISAIASGAYTQEAVRGWEERLTGVFNRGFWGGYYLGQPLGEWAQRYGNAASQRKVYCGRVTNFYARLHVAEVQLEASALRMGDRILVVGPTTGVVDHTVSSLRADDRPADLAPKGSVCSLGVPSAVRRGDKLYRVVPAQAEGPLPG